MMELLIIDDDEMVCEAFSMVAQKAGFSSVCEHRRETGLRRARRQYFDLVLLDVALPDGSGLEVIGEFQKTSGQPEIIIITGFGNPDGAELAIRSGAWDYLDKGSSIKNLIVPLQRVRLYREEKLKNRKTVSLNLENLVGKSPAMKNCFDQIAQAADSPINVLITGETGTGKEMVARAIHENSSCRDHSFVVVDCAAIPPTLLESTLFGHVKGAYTGAEYNRAGLIAQAEGGTLFLDEIGEMPLAMQKVLLRVLQERSYRQLGSDKELQSHFRLIAATNRDLMQMVEKKTFRQDLLYRLKTMEIQLPPLCERGGDIKEIARFHKSRIACRYDDDCKCLSADFLAALGKYSWPGNVRELVNAIETAFAQAGQESTLYSQHLPLDIRISLARQGTTSESSSSLNHVQGQQDILSTLPTIHEYRLEMERAYLARLLDYCNGDPKKAIAVSGLSRSAFYALQQKFKATDSDLSSESL